MKIKSYKITFILAAALCVGGCEKALDPKVDTTYGDEDQWRLPNKAQGILMKAYEAMGNRIDGYDETFLDCATDNAVTNVYSSGVYSAGQGGITVNSNFHNIWEQAYNQIENVNMFLENGLGDNINYDISQEENNLLWKKHLYGEAHFLRAWWGWQLLRFYGGLSDTGEALGYPIVLTSAEGCQLKARNTYEQCVEQIVADCEVAIDSLPARNQSGTGIAEEELLGNEGKGRATSNAAAALKAIVYLAAASEAYQPEGISAAEIQEKWERAANAAYEAILLNNNPTYLTASMWTGGAASLNEEFLLARVQGAGQGLEKRNYPPFLLGDGQTNPSQNLVDAFPMKNGYPIGHDLSEYDASNPYIGRDNRLALNVFHNQSELNGGTIDVFDGGKDSRIADSRATRTGYYLRKWIVTTVDMNPVSTASYQHVCPFIRLTELWLTFAEAANMAWGPRTAGPQTDGRTAYDIIKAVRQGSGGITSTAYLDEVADLGKEAFDKLILNERRIELSFENHRYFDLRRRMLAEEIKAGVQGVDVVLNNSEFEYTVKDVEPRPFTLVKYFYSPVPYNEILKNPQLVQNKGWNQ